MHEFLIDPFIPFQCIKSWSLKCKVHFSMRIIWNLWHLNGRLRLSMGERDFINPWYAAFVAQLTWEEIIKVTIHSDYATWILIMKKTYQGSVTPKGNNILANFTSFLSFIKRFMSLQSISFIHAHLVHINFTWTFFCGKRNRGTIR